MLKMPVGEKIWLDTPINGVSEQGKDEILRYLYDKGFDSPGKILWDAGIEWVWKTKRGTLPKRIRAAMVSAGCKLAPEFLADIGNIAYRNAERCSHHIFDFTQDFDWDDGDFGDEGSCFWGGREAARTEMLPSLNAYAVRFYRPDDEERGCARAWIVPVCEDYIILFNPYWDFGNYDGYEMARILAFYWGCNYKKILLRNNGSTDETLYINAGAGYVIGDVDRAPSSYDFECEDDGYCEYTCEHCGIGMSEDNAYCFHDDYLCYTCWCEETVECDSCYTRSWREDATRIDGYGWVCSYCLQRYWSYCHDCEEYYVTEEGCGSCPEEEEEEEEHE